LSRLLRAAVLALAAPAAAAQPLAAQLSLALEAPPRVQQAPPDGALGLAEAMRLGAARPRVQAAQDAAQASAAASQVTQHKAYWPALSAAARFEHAENLPEVGTPFGELTLGDHDRYSIDVQLRQPLLNWAVMHDLTRADALAASASSSDAARARDEGVYAAAVAYLEVLRARAQLAMAERLRDSLDARLGRVRALYENGRVLEADVLKVQLGRDQAEQQVLEFRQDLAAARAALGLAVAAGGERDAAPLGGLPERLALPGADPDAAALTRQRRDVQALDARIDAFSAKSDAIAAEWVPQVDLVASLGENRGVSILPDHDRVIGVQLSWPIFDGGTRGPRQSALNSEREALRAQREELVSGIAVQLTRARARFVTAAGLRRLALSSVRSATKTLDTRSALYEYGRVHIDEVLAAEAELVGQKAMADLADLDLVGAWVAYQLEAGTPLNGIAEGQP
jgi:outer membrane protein TolC